MAQETEIKVRIDDNEALQALREMAALVGQISDGLGGLKMSPDAVPSASSRGPSQKSKEEQEAEKLKEQRKKIFIAETKATLESLTSPQTMSGLTNRFGEMLTNIGKTIPVLGALGAYAGEGVRALGRSIAAREARLGEIMNLEALETEMRGVIETGDAQALGESRTKALEKFGLDSTQTRQFMLGVAGAAGFKATQGDLSTERLERLAGAERTGVSAQGIAALAGVLTQNMGQEVGKSLDQSLALRNIAEQKLDLRGAGVDRFLGQMGGFVEGLTARGIGATSPLARITADISGRLGQFGKGQRPMQIMNALSGVGQGAFNQISAPLQEIAQMSALAEIMSGSTDIFSAMEEAEAFQRDPSNVIDAISGMFGTGRTAQAVLGSVSGIGTRDAKSLLTRRTGAAGTFGDRLSADEITKGLTLSKAQAEETGKTIRSLRDDPKDEETFKQIIKVSGEMERSTLKMTENVELLTKVTDLQVKLSQSTTELVNTVAKAIDKLEDYLP